MQRAVLSAFLKDLVFGLGIPLGDESLRKCDLYMRIQLSRTVEVHHRRFHAHRAPKLEFEASKSVVVDESGKVALTAQGVPIDRGAVLACDRRERPPFVDREPPRLNRGQVR